MIEIRRGKIGSFSDKRLEKSMAHYGALELGASMLTRVNMDINVDGLMQVGDEVAIAYTTNNDQIYIHALSVNGKIHESKTNYSRKVFGQFNLYALVGFIAVFLLPIVAPGLMGLFTSYGQYLVPVFFLIPFISALGSKGLIKKAVARLTELEAAEQTEESEQFEG